MPATILLTVYATYRLRYSLYIRKYGNRFKRAMKDTFINRCLHFTMWIILLFYPPIARRSLEYFNCYDAINGVKYLRKDFRIPCFEGRWVTYVPCAIAAVSILLYI